MPRAHPCAHAYAHAHAHAHAYAYAYANAHAHAYAYAHAHAYTHICTGTWPMDMTAHVYRFTGYADWPKLRRAAGGIQYGMSVR